jgi:nitroimidazol reductase NimA-like FMN-containing flavoprotein (pyridoxamine 5'-phosphate oxidase superfamily)
VSEAKQQPKALRPKMDGYGVPQSSEGMLPWEWARDRFSRSHNYLLITVRPDGAPHAMPVWGVWLEDAWYFSTGSTSRKSRNLERNAKCVVCTENAEEAVIVEGTAHRLKDVDIPQRAFTDYKAKYDWELDPKLGPVWKVSPSVVFAMPEKQFPKGVTKWVFELQGSSK